MFSFKHCFYSYKGIFPCFSSNMNRLWLTRYTNTHRMLPLDTKLSHKTNIHSIQLLHLPIHGNLDYIICDLQQIPVHCFQEALEIGLKSKCKQGATSIRSKSCVSSALSHTFTSAISHLHLFLSVFFYISSKKGTKTPTGIT